VIEKDKAMDILVVGCGVSGLTTGLCLLEVGHNVTIWARDLPPQTTSNAAAAVWLPFKAFPVERVTAWGKTTFQHFKTLHAERESGVFMADVLDLKADPSADPWWVSAVERFRHVSQDELPAGYADGFSFEAPVIDTRVYLDYLLHSFQVRGGQVYQRTIATLSEAFASSNIVINCTGLGARELVGDRDLHAARGQVVRIRHNGFRRVLVDERNLAQLTYIVPRTHDIVLGGTFEEDNESSAIDPETTRAILQRCTQLVPAFVTLTPDAIVSVGCGLRPMRSTVRLEAERPAPQRLLIHNYGHGGAGVTLSWGCAMDVVALLTSILYA
jgi:D-amino-acid oxidase